jgi:predicted nucleotidyltransferase
MRKQSIRPYTSGHRRSYARGNWGVGSDLDIIIILDHTDQPFERIQLEWDTIELPVPCDLLVYTREEWVNLAELGSHFYHRLNNEVVWVYEGKL